MVNGNVDGMIMHVSLIMKHSPFYEIICTMIIESRPELEEKNLPNCTSIFLAGTIDLGNSDNWQHKLVEYLKASEGNKDVVLFNPRREDSLDLDNFDIFKQVTWELDRLEKCDIIIMNILGTSKSPITLMELGLFAKSGKLIIVCPKEFYRYNNVRIVANRYNIPLYDNLQDCIDDMMIGI